MGRPKGSIKKLSAKHDVAIQEFFRTGDKTVAAKRAGFANANVFSVPSVVERVAEIRAAMVKEIIYDAAAAMKEAEAAIAFARETRNANALVKAIELRAKLQGLLIDKHDIRQMGSFQINISGIDDKPALPPAPIEISSTPIEASEAVQSVVDNILTTGILRKDEEDDDDEETDPFS